MHTFRTQRNMRFHFFTVALVLFSGLLFRLGKIEMLVLLFTATLVLMAEMFNTAVEVVVDMITQSYHPAAKFAKDVAAGAVLIAAINAIVVGFVLFLWDGRMENLRMRLQEPPAIHVLLVGMLLMLILLVVWKVLGEKGTLLQGWSSLGAFGYRVFSGNDHPVRIGQCVCRDPRATAGVFGRAVAGRSAHSYGARGSYRGGGRITANGADLPITVVAGAENTDSSHRADGRTSLCAAGALIARDCPAKE